MTVTWSAAAQSVWGKTSSYDADAWMPLIQHLADSADVAGHVWDWLPRRVQHTIDESLPVQARDGRTLLRWLAGVHDIGKASPPFAVKVPFLAEQMHRHGLIPPRDSTDFGKAPHGLVGHVVLSRWLEERYAAAPKVARGYAVVVGGHHGVPPTSTQVGWLIDRPHLVGRGLWIDVQDEILDRMATSTGADTLLGAWSSHRLTPPAQALLTGAVIVADWLASNVELFPFDTSDGVARARLAWDEVGMQAPWIPTPAPDAAGDHLSSRFPELGGAPRPVQQLTVDAARAACSPPLLIVESGMGTGKTEAALMAAEILAERFHCGGVYFGLPTMATSDAMFGRVLDWIAHLDGDAATSVYLAHGKSGLNETYSTIARSGRLSRLHDDEVPRGRVEAQVQAWLTGRKKGVLASMVVGTIDQLLFMALQAKHAALRHVAFAGKVVVVDEVHAADDFMRMFLCRALEWLAAYGVPVVLLSATLPSAQRQELANAYRAGLNEPADALPAEASYPLITTVTADGVTTASPEEQVSSSSVALRPIQDDLDTLGELLDDWLVDDGCVAVIRNTVARAQEAAAYLQDRFGADVVLHHSRFIATHRAAREAELRAELGPGEEQRPARRIVVGTQVLEQSLDVDFDAMVTDLAPVDLILQRLGRLHRHPRRRPDRLAVPTAVVTGIVEWDEDGAPVLDRGSTAVYGDSRLLRSAGALGLGAQGEVSLRVPEDIRRLVEAAYGLTPPVPAVWRPRAEQADAKYQAALAEARVRADDFRMRGVGDLKGSLVNWLQDSSTEAEDGRSQGSARVRDSEDGIEVVVTQRVAGEVRFVADGSAFAGRLLPTDAGGTPEPEIARALAATTVRLPLSMTRSSRAFDRTLTALEVNAYEGWQQSPWLAGQLVLHLDDSWRATVGDFDLEYHLDHGLVATPREPT